MFFFKNECNFMFIYFINFFGDNTLMWRIFYFDLWKKSADQSSY